VDRQRDRIAAGGWLVRPARTAHLHVGVRLNGAGAFQFYLRPYDGRVAALRCWTVVAHTFVCGIVDAAPKEDRGMR